MTAALDTGEGVSELPKPNAIQVVTSSVMDVLGSLPVRLIILFIVAGVIMPFVADFTYTVSAQSGYSQIGRQLSEETKKKVPPVSKILQAINQYNLSWYYVTSSDGTLDPLTKPYAPDLTKYDISSGNIEWREKRYYEVVNAMGDGKLLHVGFYQGPVFAPGMALGAAAAAMPATLGYMWTVLTGTCILLIGALFLFVSKPLYHIARATGSLLLARDAYSGVTGGGLDVSGSISEIGKVAQGLKDIRRQYDELVAARVAKEDELRKSQKEFETQKKVLSKEYEEQLSQTQAKISELYTKEAEEEFINALGKELDMLKSSHQVCQRLLDKLNDKFPTSIMFGAFFKADRYQRLNLDAWLGFDDRAAQAIKKLDHTRVAREVFATSKHVTLGMEGIRDYGLTTMAQAHGIRTAVYLPIIFQSRNLGVMAIYFNTEGQTVQDRLRVLRNVVELVSRVLHQNIQYEEEQEAARTDPLTGLRNKKFFYEIMPQIMDRAAVNPEQNPVSLVIMDGDHFKSINDTYGHQVGDQMLQELAKLIKTCVRTTDSLEKLSAPGDYLIRFGGEEFIIVMENTESKRAMSVAERVRQAIEAKSDWPAGIAKWTVSIGCSTFPTDGKSTDDLLAKADTALYYVKEVLDRNKCIHSQQVPKSYKSAKSAAAVSGELGVFDPAALLQSLATASKTGVLTVQAPDGRQLWCLFESGKPMQARMGKHAGAAAVVEFVSTFEEGAFNFQEKSMSGKETMTKLPRLDENFNISKSLERLLMDGALAQDNYNAAKKIIPTLNMLIRPVAPVEFAARWQQLGQIEEPPMPEEFNVMSDIVQRADGNTTLHNIFRNMEGIPTHLMWRSAALLVQYNLVQTKIAAGAGQ
ncbi:MAG: diguanylate cyclase [Candidatus Obscuribacterales bacterium]|nr:diguanylate cyclase [Candidatus Obscuribacterales bacterium]